ncbi:DUF4159 domain-containing protein [Dongia mobilis]|uniref:DUF4159 domain-containing protein n=1 Tax=Dongia sp. TaxID=1977262 RepID=UPI0026EE79CE
MNFGNLSILVPALLAAFIALPILWWLLRLTPPSPKRINFPAIRLLFGLMPKEETPHRTPWWLILLRVSIAALVIAALSHPVWNAGETLSRPGPMLLVIDNGWAAAPHWSQTSLMAENLIDQADREGRTVLLIPTAPALGQATLAPPDSLAPAQAKAAIANLAPQPWTNRRDLVETMLKQMAEKGALDQDLNITWLSDGTAGGDSDKSLAAQLGALGALRIVGPRDLPVILRPAKVDAGGLRLQVERAMVGASQAIDLRVLDAEGRTISLATVRFAANQNATEAKIELPLELRGRVGAVALQQPADAESGHAGGVVLLDDAAGSKPIGVITYNTTAARQPLLGELYYVERALQPFNELRVGNVSTLAKQPLAVMILPDGSNISDSDRASLAAWVEAGGTLIRFAGERLALAAGDDNLLPVRLRQGDRVLGGALSWSAPASLAPFPTASPFVGLATPKDVTVDRQVLAQPDIDLGSRTWARLSDGTPLVTGAKRGEGYIVLFHVSANTSWSTLALSGLYVEMLNRLLLLAAGVPNSGQDKATPLPPSQLLDGYGRLMAAPTSITPLSPEDFKEQRAGPLHPPGLYGAQQARSALNLTATLPSVSPLSLPTEPLTHSHAIDWKPWLLLLAALLLAADCLIGLYMRGLLSRGGRGAALGQSGLGHPGKIAGAILLVAFGLVAMPAQVFAQDVVQPMSDEEIIAATETTHLAYVRTGIPNVDATSRAGLFGLTNRLLERTSADMGDPVGVDLNVDTLDFYPILYWPIAGSSETLDDRAIAEINRYLAGGGMILFDTADQNVVGITGGLGPGAMRLQEITGGLEIPPLAPVAADHVLTRSFYLLKDFPGRWVGGTLWVENSQSRVNDGVASVIVGSNDYASAWAMDDYGQPLFPVTPGGERQREFAYRFGINLVMYALTGKYKEDQVHVPAILERLGQ